MWLGTLDDALKPIMNKQDHVTQSLGTGGNTIFPIEQGKRGHSFSP